jgi:hypothetical protein
LLSYRAASLLAFLSLLFGSPLMLPFAAAQNGGDFFGGINYAAGITPQEVFDEIDGAGLGNSPGFYLVAAQVGDFNNDGKPDIVVAGDCTTTFSALCTNGSAVAVYLGNGDGTFRTPPIVASGISSTIRAIFVGDFNNDGNLDVLAENDEQPNCYNTACGTVTVLLGNGRGGLSISAVYNLAGGINYQSATAFATGDFNADGKLDFAVSTFCSTPICNSGDSVVQVFLGNGNGTFGTPSLYDAGSYRGTSAVASADFNGDGNLDLLLSNPGAPGNDPYHGSISLFLGNGNGTFQAPTTTALSVPPGVAGGLAIGDFNSDGNIDLAIASFSAVDVVFGNGNGTFQPAVSYPVGNYSSSLTVGDFNSDGKLDLAVGSGLQASGENSVNLLINNGSGAFQVGPTYGLGGWEFANVVAADFNGDGKVDILLASECRENSGMGEYCSDGTISVLLGNGDGTMQAANSANLTVNPHHMVLADLNGDGIEDIVGTEDCYQNDCPTEQGGVVVALGLGNGTFAPATEYPTGADTQVPSGLAVGDFNGDGKTDVVVTGYGVSVLLGNGDGTLRAPVVYSTTQNVYGPPGVGDFAGNGKLGVAVLHQIGSTRTNASVGVLLGNGDGTLQPEVITQASEITGYQLTVGDFNNDGKADVAVIGEAVALPQYSAITVFLGNGDGTLTVKPDPYTNPPDDYLIVCNGSICVPLASYPTYGSVGTYSPVGASITNAALSPGGNLDLVASSTCVINDQSCSTGMIASCAGQGDGTFFCGVVGHKPLPDANYLGVAVADVTKDGLPDIVATTRTGVAVYPNGDHGGTVYAGASLADAEMPAVADLNGDGAADIAVSNNNGVTILYNRFPSIATSTTTLISSSNPSKYGKPVILTATVTSTVGIPAGKVQFLEGSTVLATVKLASGTAKYTTSKLATGTSVITAVFGGDSKNRASTSLPLYQEVQEATTTTLSSSPNPSAYEQAVTFTATVASGLGAPPNGETVSFLDGKTVLGSGTLSGGAATFTTSALKKGTTAVKAVYDGDSTFAASTSGTVKQVVN